MTPDPHAPRPTPAQQRWGPLCAGTSVGHRRIQCFAPVEVDGLALRVALSQGEPIVRRLAVYSVG